MKWLLNLLQKGRPLFEEQGRLHRFKPVFDATENFLFSPATRTPGAPHVRDPLDVKRYMSVVIIALAPCVICALYFFGLRLLPMIAVSYAAGGAVEVLFAVVRKEEINEGFLVTGLIFPLTLPPTLPLWIVAVGIVFGVLVGKELFGGTGRNLFNPALVGRCFLALSYPAAMSRQWIEAGSGLLGRLTTYMPDAITGATPLVQAKRALSGGEGILATRWDLFIGRVAGSAGETSALAILVGGAFLLLTRVASWRTVAGILGSFVLLGAVLHAVQPAVFGSVEWQLLAGGLLFGAFFMATDPVSSPITNGGRWAYGILIGVATLLIRHLTGFVEGAMFAILMGNIAAPILDEVAVRHRLRRLELEK